MLIAGRNTIWTDAFPAILRYIGDHRQSSTAFFCRCMFVVFIFHHFMLNDNFLNNKSQFVLSSCTLFHFLAVWIISCEGFGLNFAGKICR